MSDRGTNPAGQELHRYLSYAKANNDEFEIFIRDETPPKEEFLFRVRSPTDPNKLIYVSTVKSDIYSVISPIKLSTIIQEEEKKVGFTLPAFAIPSNYNNDDNNVTLYSRAEDNDVYSFSPIKPRDFDCNDDDFGGSGYDEEKKEESQTFAVGGLVNEDISFATPSPYYWWSLEARAS